MIYINVRLSVLAGNAEHVEQKCVFPHKNGFIEFCTRAWRTEVNMKKGERCRQKNRNAAFVRVTRSYDLVLMKSAYSILVLTERTVRTIAPRAHENACTNDRKLIFKGPASIRRRLSKECN